MKKKIKIFSLSYCDSGGGASIAYRRINLSLSRLNFHKFLYVIEKRLKDKSINLYGNSFDQILRRLRFYLTKLIFLSNLKYTKSINLFNSGLGDYINKGSFDIINFHWIGCETISLSEIRKINKPIVWILHDMYPILGIYHYSLDQKFFEKENKNILKKKYFYFLDRLTKKRKKALFQNKKIHLISPSRWLLEKAKKTKLPFGEMEVIPYPIDTTYFKIKSNIKDLKKKYKVPNDKKILLYSSNILNEPRKGSKVILSLIKKKFFSKNKYILLMIGQNNNFIKTKNDDIILLGNISNYNLIKEIYSIADVLLFPSIIDNFPNTLLEAMSCNLPCVAFNCYGMKEIITHKKNGYLAKPYSAEDFIKGIDYSLKRQKTLSQESRKYVVNNFKNEKINNKYYKYFKKIKFIK